MPSGTQHLAGEARELRGHEGDVDKRVDRVDEIGRRGRDGRDNERAMLLVDEAGSEDLCVTQ